MSNSHLFMKSGFPRAPLQNGLGRYVCQLQRITLKFCKTMGCSKGVRDFIENQLVDFAKTNPGVVVYVKPRRHRQPVIVAEYLNGDRQSLPVRSFTEEQITKWIDMMRTQSMNTSALRMRKHWHTDWPSIQGAWTPFTHQPQELTKASLPDDKWSEPLEKPMTATVQIARIVRETEIKPGRNTRENQRNIATMKFF